jgi:ribosomal protein S12 methylthiotransferase
VDGLVELMAQGLVLPYLDVPFQHSHPDVLRRMKRPANGEKNLERIAKWRQICPELVIRSTFIVGFPGETEAEFEDLLEFMTQAQIDRAGCFVYSPVEGAAANALDNPVDPALQADRKAQFMGVAESVSTAKLRQRVGSRLTVLVDEVKNRGRQGATARSYADAPEIDGVVHIEPLTKASQSLQVGQFAKVEIVTTQGHDLVGCYVG